MVTSSTARWMRQQTRRTHSSRSSASCVTTPSTHHPHSTLHERGSSDSVSDRSEDVPVVIQRQMPMENGSSRAARSQSTLGRSFFRSQERDHLLDGGLAPTRPTTKTHQFNNTLTHNTPTHQHTNTRRAHALPIAVAKRRHLLVTNPTVLGAYGRWCIRAPIPVV